MCVMLSANIYIPKFEAPRNAALFRQPSLAILESKSNGTDSLATPLVEHPKSKEPKTMNVV